MNYENFISYRYLVASKGRFLTFLNVISIVGVAIGVAALIVVIGVMTGFGNNLREKIIGTTPHVMIEKEIGITGFDEIRKKVLSLEGVLGASPYIQGNIFLENRSGQALGVIIRGVNPLLEKQITKVDQFFQQGKLEELTNEGIIIGSEMARFFGYELGDTVTLISPGSGIAGKGWRYQLRVAGIFKTGMADYDMQLIIVTLPKAQEIFNYASDQASGIGVKLYDPYQANELKSQILQLLGYSFMVRSWIDINRNLFEALFLEKWGLFIVLTLMVLVASFNIISTLIVTVTSKIHDIGVLQSIGVPRRAIRKIFTRQGVLIGVVGTIWGLIGGYGLSYLLKTYVKVPQEIYSIEHVPIEIKLFDVLAIVCAAMVISYLATIYPASRAASLQPVDALRYE